MKVLPRTTIAETATPSSDVPSTMSLSRCMIGLVLGEWRELRDVGSMKSERADSVAAMKKECEYDHRL